MKRNPIPKPALACLITGLLLAAFTPIISRYILLPDFFKGFLGGLGLMLEFFALVQIQRNNKDMKCSRG